MILGFHIPNILKTNAQGKKSPHLRYKVLLKTWDIFFNYFPFTEGKTGGYHVVFFVFG